jgi:hypothetical protein
MLFLLVMKQSSSILGCQATTRPPLTPQEATCVIRKKPSLLRIAETWRGEGIWFKKEKKNFRGLIMDQNPQTLNCNWPREPFVVSERIFMAASEA